MNRRDGYKNVFFMVIKGYTFPQAVREDSLVFKDELLNHNKNP